MHTRIIVHGGAWDIPDKQVMNHKQGCKRAVEEGLGLLKEGASALDAVEYAIRFMEDDPTYDAGKGAFLNLIGEVELDAIICDGKNQNFGAIAAVRNVLHPISLARRIMEQTEHTFLVGEGAFNFAKTQKMALCRTEDLLVGRELARWKKLQQDPTFHTKQIFENYPHGTVGAVAIDKDGNLASGTSTGGTPRKMPGRVGDTPLIGCGAYADARGAISSTGWGESIMRVVLAHQVSFYLETGISIDEAAKKAICLLETRIDGLGGVIAIDQTGNIGWAYNTPRMALAYGKEEEDKIFVSI